MATVLPRLNVLMNTVYCIFEISGQDMGLGSLGMANSKSGDYNLFSSG